MSLFLACLIAVRKHPALRPKAQCHALLVLYVMKYLSFQLIFSNLFLSKFRCDSIHSSYLKWFDVSIHNPQSRIHTVDVWAADSTKQNGSSSVRPIGTQKRWWVHRTATGLILFPSTVPPDPPCISSRPHNTLQRYCFAFVIAENNFNGMVKDTGIAKWIFWQWSKQKICLNLDLRFCLYDFWNQVVELEK